MTEYANNHSLTHSLGVLCSLGVAKTQADEMIDVASLLSTAPAEDVGFGTGRQRYGTQSQSSDKQSGVEFGFCLQCNSSSFFLTCIILSAHHNTTQHNTTQHTTIQYNTTQHNTKLFLHTLVQVVKSLFGVLRTSKKWRSTRTSMGSSGAATATWCCMLT